MSKLFGFVDKIGAAFFVEHTRNLAFVFRITTCDVHRRHDFYKASLCLAQLVFQSATFQQAEVVVQVDWLVVTAGQPIALDEFLDGLMAEKTSSLAIYS